MLRDKLLFLFFRKITNNRNIGLNDASLLVSKNTTILAYFYEIFKICNDSRIMRIIINYAFGSVLLPITRKRRQKQKNGENKKASKLTKKLKKNIFRD